MVTVSFVAAETSIVFVDCDTNNENNSTKTDERMETGREIRGIFFFFFSGCDFEFEFDCVRGRNTSFTSIINEIV